MVSKGDRIYNRLLRWKSKPARRIRDQRPLGEIEKTSNKYWREMQLDWRKITFQSTRQCAVGYSVIIATPKFLTRTGTDLKAPPFRSHFLRFPSNRKHHNFGFLSNRKCFFKSLRTGIEETDFLYSRTFTSGIGCPIYDNGWAPAGTRQWFNITCHFSNS